MATCKKCGKEYLTRECLKCKGTGYQYNKKAIDSIKIKERAGLLKMAFVALLLISFGAGALGVFKIIELTESNNKVIKEIHHLKVRNQRLEKINRTNLEVIQNYRNENRRLRGNNTYTRNSNIRAIKNEKPYTKRNTAKNHKTTTTEKRYYEPSRNKTTTAKPKYTKKYQSFSRNIKLTSDSKITKHSNNKLTSNARIIGRYYPKAYSVVNPKKNQIADIRCGLKENRYNATDECSMTISNDFDKVYLGTMNARSIREFDYRTHMIECNYSKEHGIMHDCRISIYKRKVG